MIEPFYPRNRSPARGRPGLAIPRTLAALMLLGMALPAVVDAQATFNPYVSAQVEHDSNVFRVPNAQTAALLTGDSTLSDTDERYIAGVNGTYLWSIQKLTGNFEARRIEYNHFGYLSHSEYLGNLQLDWKLARALDGILQYRQERLAAAFENRNSSTLTVNMDRNIVGRLNYNFMPDWRLETGVNFHTLEAPLQLYPGFTEHETGSRLGIDYLGLANLTYGVLVERTDGDYTHAVGVGPYRQTSFLFTTTYKVSGLSSLNGSIGYTTRNQTLPAGNVSAVTGNIGYTRQLTGKTSLNLQLVRAVNSYVAAGGSEIDTMAAFGVNWQTTYKLGVGINYSYIRSTFAGNVIPGSATVGRLDHTQQGLFNVTYQLFRQLQIKGYVSRQSRSSNYELDTFNDTTVGFQALAHWR
jgi:hypothetical protein